MSWPMVKLGDVFTVARGGSPRPIDSFITEDPDGLNWIMIGDTKGVTKYIESTAKKIKPEGLKKTREVFPGDFLLSNSMSFGKPYILKVQGCIHDGWLVLSPKENQVDTDYFYHYLSSTEIKNKLASKAAGAVVKNLNSEIVRQLEILLPPLEEQKRIAAILDKTDVIRRKRQQAIELVDEFLRSVFLDMFGDPVVNPKGWEVKAVGAITDCIVPGRDKPKSFTGETPWVTTNDLKHLGLTKEANKFLGLSNQEIKQVKAKIVPMDSVLMTCVGDLGVISIANNEMVINQQLHAFLPCSDMKSSYLMYALSFQKGFMLKMASSTTLPYMNKTVCNSIPVPVPPIKLQSQFDEIFKSVLINKEKTVSSLANINNLFKSLSQKAFSGEL